MTITEGSLTFEIPDHLLASKYDEWQFYRGRFGNFCGGAKGVDILIFEPADRVLWLVEIKDYRVHSRTKSIDIGDELAEKVRDTIAGILVAAATPTTHNERATARQLRTANSVRVVLHYEDGSSIQRQRQANIHQKIKQKLRAVDPHSQVSSMASMGTLEWTVS